MAEVEYLPITKEGIKKQPDTFAISINDNDYGFKISYNPIDNRFYMGCFTNNEVLILGKRFIYGVDLLEEVDNADFKIVSLSKTGNGQNGINYNNFMDDVKPYIITGSGS